MISEFIKFHFPFFFWLAAIFVQSSFPASAYPEIEFFNADKIVHILVYGLLGALCYISLIHQKKFKLLESSPYIFTLLFCSFYGFSDEFHQYFVPNRDANVYDWIADAAGVILIIVIIKFILSKRFTLFNKRL